MLENKIKIAKEKLDKKTAVAVAKAEEIKQAIISLAGLTDENLTTIDVTNYGIRFVTEASQTTRFSILWEYEGLEQKTLTAIYLDYYSGKLVKTLGTDKASDEEDLQRMLLTTICKVTLVFDAIVEMLEIELPIFLQMVKNRYEAFKVFRDLRKKD